MSGTLPIVSRWTADITGGYTTGHTSGAETIDIGASVVEDGRAVLDWGSIFVRRPLTGAVKGSFPRVLLKRQGGALVVCDQQQPAAIGTAADLTELTAASASLVIVGDTTYIRCVGVAGMELDWGVDHDGWFTQAGA